VNVRILLSLAPVMVFVLLKQAGAPAAISIGGGFSSSTIVFFLNRKARLIGWLTLFGFSLVAVGALVGIAWGNEKAYLASGPLSDYLFVPLYLGSIYVRQPLIGGISHQLFPRIAGHVPRDAMLFVYLSLAWAAYSILHGLIRTYLLMHLSVGEYLIWSRVVGWPTSAVMLGLSAWLIIREANRIRSVGTMEPVLG
jgi:hypothetical protein